MDSFLNSSTVCLWKYSKDYSWKSIENPSRDGMPEHNWDLISSHFSDTQSLPALAIRWWRSTLEEPIRNPLWPPVRPAMMTYAVSCLAPVGVKFSRVAWMLELDRFFFLRSLLLLVLWPVRQWLMNSFACAHLDAICCSSIGNGIPRDSVGSTVWLQSGTGDVKWYVIV